MGRLIALDFGFSLRPENSKNKYWFAEVVGKMTKLQLNLIVGFAKKCSNFHPEIGAVLFDVDARGVICQFQQYVHPRLPFRCPNFKDQVFVENAPNLIVAIARFEKWMDDNSPSDVHNGTSICIWSETDVIVPFRKEVTTKDIGFRDNWKQYIDIQNVVRVSALYKKLIIGYVTIPERC